MNLVWLDYDGAFSEGMLSDIETLCRRLYVGSMFLYLAIILSQEKPVRKGLLLRRALVIILNQI